MLFSKIKNYANEEIIINKGVVKINEYKKIIDLNNDLIKLLNITIKGKNLFIKILTKEYIIIQGKIGEIIFNEEQNK